MLASSIFHCQISPFHSFDLSSYSFVQMEQVTIGIDDLYLIVKALMSLLVLSFTCAASDSSVVY